MKRVVNHSIWTDRGAPEPAALPAATDVFRYTWPTIDDPANSHQEGQYMSSPQQSDEIAQRSMGTDWRGLSSGQRVEVHDENGQVGTGRIDEKTLDSKVLWICFDRTGERRMFSAGDGSILSLT